MHPAFQGVIRLLYTRSTRLSLRVIAERERQRDTYTGCAA